MYQNKTAKYTIEGPMHLGLILADREDLLSRASSFALPLGIAFQIQDDLLGLYGKTEDTGKLLGKDIAEGKTTLLYNKSLELLNKEDTKTLQGLFGKQTLSEGEVGWIQATFENCGAKQYAEEKIHSAIEEARRALDVLCPAIALEQREFFLGLCEYMAERNQ